jgi:hypothetical protein
MVKYRSIHICRDGEMVDALALGASGETHGGSSPLLGTLNIICTLVVQKTFKD